MSDMLTTIPFSRKDSIVRRRNISRATTKWFLRDNFGQCRSRSVCVCAQSDQDLHCPLTEYVYVVYIAEHPILAKADLGLLCPDELYQKTASMYIV